MDRRTRWITGGAVALAIMGGGTGIAIATSGDDDTPLRGSTLEQATAAALAAVGSGTVTETEVGDDGAAYSVEIRLDDGSQVEVGLDEDFNVIARTGDDDGPGDGTGPDED